MYNTLIIIQHAGHISKFFYRKHQMTHFLRLFLFCNANMYSRMAGKLSKGSNSSTFKTVSADIGVIGMQGKALKYEKLQYWQQKKKKKKKRQKTSNKMMG